MSQFSDLLTKALADNCIELSTSQVQQLSSYLELLSKWNRAYNLTAITHPREMVYLHIIDSLLIEPHIVGTACLDVGTGGGLPGIPLAIARPDLSWVLLDKNSKKTRFLTQAIADLGLKQAIATHSRIEDLPTQQGFDTITSRAFASLRLFAETTLPVLKSEGRLLAMKGKYPTDELAELPSSVSVESVMPLTMKGMDIERHIVQLKLNAKA